MATTNTKSKVIVNGAEISDAYADLITGAVTASHGIKTAGSGVFKSLKNLVGLGKVSTAEKIEKLGKRVADRVDPQDPELKAAKEKLDNIKRFQHRKTAAVIGKVVGDSVRDTVALLRDFKEGVAGRASVAEQALTKRNENTVTE
ncbi:hypothetical protein [Acinetobacter sp.]|uniref:hypothetical protein n=1 Tax=Acinetobacter sp. TaxID=472 RepID=UPI003D070BC4